MNKEGANGLNNEAEASVNIVGVRAHERRLPFGGDLYNINNPHLREKIEKLRKDLGNLMPTKNLFPDTDNRSWILFFTIMNNWPIFTFPLVCVGCVVIWTAITFETEKEAKELCDPPFDAWLAGIRVIGVGICYAACISTWLENREFLIHYASDRAPPEAELLLCQYEIEYSSPYESILWKGPEPIKWNSLWEFNLSIRYAIVTKILKKMSNQEYEEAAFSSEENMERKLITEKLRNLLSSQNDSAIKEEGGKHNLKFKEIWPENRSGCLFASFLILDSNLMTWFTICTHLFPWFMTLALTIATLQGSALEAEEDEYCVPIFLMFFYSVVFGLFLDCYWMVFVSLVWMRVRVWILKKFSGQE